MRFRGVAERQLAIDAQPKTTLPDPGEHLAGAPQKLLPIDDVVQEGRTCQERALLRQTQGIERRHRSARLTEEHEHAAACDAVETLVERRLADGVVHDVDSFAAA